MNGRIIQASSAGRIKRLNAFVRRCTSKTARNDLTKLWSVGTSMQASVLHANGFGVALQHCVVSQPPLGSTHASDCHFTDYLQKWRYGGGGTGWGYGVGVWCGCEEKGPAAEEQDVEEPGWDQAMQFAVLGLRGILRMPLKERKSVLEPEIIIR